MEKLKQINLNKWIGYILLALYVVSAIGFVYYCTTLNLFPGKYIVIMAIVFAILAVLIMIMHERILTSIIASILTIVLIVGCILGSHYIIRTSQTMKDVSTSDVQTDIVSVYVMEDDPAEVLEDVRDYTIGIVNEPNEKNAKKTIESLEAELGGKLNTKSSDSMFTMMDELKAGTVQAILLNDAYAGIVADVEKYDWVATDLRKITEVAHVIDVENEDSVPEAVPETFIMYLSGIDTYGGVSARSRSDVNILAVINTKTKNILLLSTPRDSYVEFNETGGAKDKLTHAGIYGVEASMNALECLYDVQVDYYLRINFSGFVDIIDALGGIDVNSEYEFTVDPIKTYTVGVNHLTGLEALAFARERYSFADGDYQRAKNQMEVIRAVIQKCASSSLLKNYGTVMNAVAGSFETNMPQEQIAALVKMQLSDMAQWTVSSYTTGGTSMYAETFSMPGQELYVIELDPAAVEEAKQLIQEVFATSTEMASSNKG